MRLFIFAFSLLIAGSSVAQSQARDDFVSRVDEATIARTLDQILRLSRLIEDVDARVERATAQGSPERLSGDQVERYYRISGRLSACLGEDRDTAFVGIDATARTVLGNFLPQFDSEYSSPLSPSNRRNSFITGFNRGCGGGLNVQEGRRAENDMHGLLIAAANREEARGLRQQYEVVLSKLWFRFQVPPVQK